MNKNIKLLFGLLLISVLSFFLFEDKFDAFAQVGYGYGYGYGYSAPVNRGSNGGTYYQRPFFTGTEQLTLTNYGRVGITTYGTGKIIKLLDLRTYLDRSEPKQDAFGNKWKLESKGIKSMPDVGVNSTETDLILLIENSLELIK